MRAGVGDLTLKLVPFNLIAANNNRLQRTPPPFLLQPYRMAEAPRTTITPASHPIQPNTDSKPKPPANTPKEIPPPPEKPEAGDCCGSGCVRCVWDIYYDELEEYNRIYKQDPNPKS